MSDNTVVDAGLHPSRFLLDQLINGDVSTGRAQELQAHVEACPQCTAYCRVIGDRAERITDRYTTFEQLHRARRKQESNPLAGLLERLRRSALSTRVAMAFGTVALLCLVLVYYPRQSREDVLTMKGGPTWQLYANGVLYSNPQDTIRISSGGQLQLLMRISAPIYYHVFYRDDNGALQSYCCETAQLLQPAAGGKETSLPFSIELDSAWKSQDLYCLSSSKPLTAESATQLIRDWKNGKSAQESNETWIMQFHLVNTAQP
jgi:hypothetical protein